MMRALTILLLTSTLLAAGCGTIKGRTATEQLLVSDAVDQSVEQIDFSQLAGQDVYLDSQFLRAVRGVGFVNAEYIISSLRQRMILANCRLREKADQASYIVEVRVGALGSDCHEVNYGVPGSQALNQTAALVSSAPLPAVPEISLARTDSCRAAAKISLFAYERETRAPVWESGTAQGTSLAKSTWILGAGPFQKGDIYEDGIELQATPIELPEVQDARFLQPMIAMLKRPLFRRTTVDEAQPSTASPAMLAEVSNAPTFKAIPSPAWDIAPPPAFAELATASVDEPASEVILATATQPVTEQSSSSGS